MQTDALALARRLHAEGRPERLAWGAVELSVTDLERALSFWTGSLGLIRRGPVGAGQALGTERDTLVILHPGANRPVDHMGAGLYHVAIGVPEQREFSRILARLIELDIRIAPVDHLMSKAIYFNDPDGHAIEVAYETPERFGRFSTATDNFGLFDRNGAFHNGREPLNLRAELAAAAGVDTQTPIASSSVIAHLHFRVPALGPALRFFETLGFARNLNLPKMGFADMGAGGSYTHRLALNAWSGPDIEPANRETARLVRYTLKTTQALPSPSPPIIDPVGIDIHLASVI